MSFFEIIVSIFAVLLFLLYAAAILDSIIKFFIWIGENTVKRYKNLYSKGGRERVSIEITFWLLIGFILAFLIKFLTTIPWFYTPYILLGIFLTYAIAASAIKNYKEGGIEKLKEKSFLFLSITLGNILFWFLFFKFPKALVYGFLGFFSLAFFTYIIQKIRGKY
jgi:hypothetical protein